MAARLFFVAASAVALVSAQFPAPPSNPIQGCTTRSFLIPSWLVQDVKRSADGSVSFDVLSRGGGWTACSIQGTAPSNGTLTATAQVAEDSTTFLVNQTWTCNDRGPVMTFSATGNNSAALNFTSPVLIRGSLTSPVAITPQYPEGPEGHDLAGCTARSEKPSWVLSTIHFTDEPGDGVTSTPFQNFNLIVTNPANGYQASCMPGGSLGGTPDLSQLVCAGSEFQSSLTGRHTITTQASFDPATMTFSLNQTWFCDDTDASKPLQINAAGSTVLPLNCTTQPAAGTNQTNRYCSSTGDVDLEGKLGTVVTLQAYSLTDPVAPFGDGCTLTSIFNPAWEFSAFEVDDTNNGGGGSNDTSSSASVSFGIILAAQNRGFQFPIAITQGNATAGAGAGWYECAIGPDGGDDLPLWPYQCVFRYTAATKELQLRADWACRDLDQAHPIYFRGVTTTTVNSTLTCETAGGQSQCTTADPAFTWDAKISNVTWGMAAAAPGDV
ncbi:uncharacterized protein THITE_117079 [Thermothielavioides terrestris NRRL 8126]|uniref:AA1-like domain-containing protein n=1 Tax=Thermothielavioides terrestris (strain ATCC 38088 / NRRL 8126) TaxID=578455 RepID=G2RGA0_THETT|nr:uncharacterized protein THITE_117079 [Thermothielavioides terrestris NRRL 8126]AEO71843.1 hypothetical protein THITE_117079 [Thermothielavioides terrestris NRRL 8126]